MSRSVVLALAVALGLAGAQVARAQFCETDCANVCTGSSLCSESCTEDCDQPSSCGAYGVCDIDPDDDGVISNDNCPLTYNPSQANCDGDSAGDVCDSLNAAYYPTAGSQACHIVGRTHFAYFDVALHTEAPIHDSSSCGAPDGWAHYGGPTLSCSWLQAQTLLACCDLRFGPVLCTQYLNNNQCHPAILTF